MSESATPHDGAELQYEEVLVGKPPPLKVEFAAVPIDEIELDQQNPRLRFRSQLNGATLIDQLFEEEDTKHLKLDIKANGLFERPFVRRIHSELLGTTRYIAKEGNRRAAVYMKLHAEEPGNPQWQTMPVRVLPENTTPEQLAMMLCQFHVVGKLKWNAHERAGQIYEMAVTLDMPEDVIKTVLHMGKPAIDKAKAAYAMMMEKYVRIDGGRYKEEAEGKFSYFDEFQKKKPLRDLAEADSFFADDFCRWVGTGRLPRAEDVRQLPAILSNDIAKRTFTESEAPQALRRSLETLARNDATRRSSFFKKLREAIDAGRETTMTDFVTANTPSGRQLLLDARAVLDHINRHAEASASGPLGKTSA